MSQTSNARSKPADFILYVAVLFTWIAIWRIHSLIPGAEKLPMAMVAEILTLVLFLADTDRDRQVRWIRSPILWIIFALFAIMLAGLPTSLYPGKGFIFITKEFSPIIILTVVLATSVRERGDLEWLAFANLVGGVILALYVYKFCPVGWDGKLTNLPYYDANDFALLINCTIPFAIFFLRPGVKPGKRLFALGAFVLFAIMIVRSGSRGGFLGLVAVALYTLFRYQAIPARLRIGAIAAGVVVFAAAGSASYWKAMNTLIKPENDYNLTEETGRKAVWKRGLLYMQMRPVTGVGIRAFPEAEGKLSPTAKRYAEYGRGIKWSVAHNSFVEIGAECGVLALTLFFGMFGFAFGTLGRVRAGPKGSPLVAPADQAYAQMLFASLLAFCVSGFFISAEYFAYLYVLLALLMGQQAVLRRRAARRAPQSPAVAAPPRQSAARPVTRRAGRGTWTPAAS